MEALETEEGDNPIYLEDITELFGLLRLRPNLGMGRQIHPKAQHEMQLMWLTVEATKIS